MGAAGVQILAAPLSRAKWDVMVSEWKFRYLAAPLKNTGIERCKEAIAKGQKKKQIKSGLTEAFYSYYSIVYDEDVYQEIKIRKIYPITVKMW